MLLKLYINGNLENLRTFLMFKAYKIEYRGDVAAQMLQNVSFRLRSVQPMSVKFSFYNQNDNKLSFLIRPTLNIFWIKQYLA